MILQRMMLLARPIKKRNVPETAAPMKYTVSPSKEVKSEIITDYAANFSYTIYFVVNV